MKVTAAMKIIAENVRLKSEINALRGDIEALEQALADAQNRTRMECQRAERMAAQ